MLSIYKLNAFSAHKWKHNIAEFVRLGLARTMVIGQKEKALYQHDIDQFLVSVVDLIDNFLYSTDC